MKHTQHASRRIASIFIAANLAAAMPTLAQNSNVALKRAHQESNATVLAAQLLSRWAPIAQAAPKRSPRGSAKLRVQGCRLVSDGER